jgi:hypothetical protein
MERKESNPNIPQAIGSAQLFVLAMEDRKAPLVMKGT